MIAVRLSYADGKAPSHGTGFLVRLAPTVAGGPERLGVLTAHHVLRSPQDLPSVHLFVRDEKWWPRSLGVRAYLEGEGADAADWALLELEESLDDLTRDLGGRAPEAARLRPASRDTDTRFRIVGFPDSKRWYPDSGIIQGVDVVDAKQRSAIDLVGAGAAPAAPGFSGAPITSDHDGMVIGIVRMGRTLPGGANAYSGLDIQRVLERTTIEGRVVIVANPPPPPEDTLKDYVGGLFKNYPIATGVSLLYFLAFACLVVLPASEALGNARIFTNIGKGIGLIGSLPGGLALAHLWRRFSGLFGRRGLATATLALLLLSAPLTLGAVYVLRLSVSLVSNYTNKEVAGLAAGAHRFVRASQPVPSLPEGFCKGAIDVPECVADPTAAACSDALARLSCAPGTCIATTAPTWLDTVDAILVGGETRIGCSCKKTAFGSFVHQACGDSVRSLPLEDIRKHVAAKTSSCGELCETTNVTLKLPADADAWEHATLVCRAGDTAAGLCLDIAPVDPQSPRFTIPAAIPVPERDRQLTIFADGCVTLAEYPPALFGAAVLKGVNRDTLVSLGAGAWTVHRACNPRGLDSSPDRPFAFDKNARRGPWVPLTLRTPTWETRFATESAESYESVTLDLCTSLQSLTCPDWSATTTQWSPRSNIWIRGSSLQLSCRADANTTIALERRDHTLVESGCATARLPGPSTPVSGTGAPPAGDREPCENLTGPACSKLACKRPYRLVIEENGAVQLMNVDGIVQGTAQLRVCSRRFDRTFNAL